MRRERLKQALLSLPPVEALWGGLRDLQLQRDYEARRERYARTVRERGLVYDEAGAVAAIRARLASRGYSPRPRRPGEVHTFTFVPRLGWHTTLLGDLAELGPVSEFDYVAEGFSVADLQRSCPRAAANRAALNALALGALRSAHLERPVDWVFVYASGLEVEGDWPRRVTEELGVPVVNMCLDDKQSWEGDRVGLQRSGQIDIAAGFDVSWTSSRIACEWYQAEGARPLYLPEGFDAATFRPLAVPKDLPVSFVGAGYGYRPSLVRHLRRCGVDVRTFGAGWGPGGWVTDVVPIFNRSVVNLGMGGVGWSERLTTLKGRDVEIPATGGGVYLTSYNPELARLFVVGREILCYSTRDELVELARHCLVHPDEAAELAARARARALGEHRWLHRYLRMLEALGVVQAPAKA